MDKVELAIATAKEIRESIDFVVHIKEKAVLRSCGVSVESDTDDAYESEESCSDSEYSICDETVSEACNDSSNDNVPTEAPSLASFLGERINNDMYNSKAVGSHEFSLPENPDICKQVTETGETYLNTHQLMDLLQECQLNWYCFAEVMKQKLASHGKEHLLDQVLLDFSGQIPFLNITLHDEKLIEQGRQAYLADHRSNNLEVNDTEDVIFSESEEEREVELLSGVTYILQPAAREALEKRVKAICLKARREAVKQITERRLLKRKLSWHPGRILREYPDIGRTVEELLQNNGVGADVWRRTDVLITKIIMFNTSIAPLRAHMIKSA